MVFVFCLRASATSDEMGFLPNKLTSTAKVKVDCHNDVLRAQQLSVDTYKHVAVEIPEGLPQVRYFGEDQWVPRGDVLRCLIHDDEERQPVIQIDDQEFTLEEFGSMLVSHAGWGMRVVFVPDNEINKKPEIVVKDADTE